MQPLIDLGGNPENPAMHMALANGFVPQTYLPLLRHFHADYHTVCLPPRALWGAGDPPPLDGTEPDWTQLADDLLAGFAQYGLRDVVAIGHSFGGIATLLAALKQPDAFKALILLDPTILAPQILASIAQARAQGQADKMPLAQMALRRRSEFESAEAAFERFRGKSLFAQWPDETLRLYAEHGTVPAPGAGVALAWPPQWEAFYFATGYVKIWEDLPAINALPLPILFVSGGDSDTFLPQSAAKVREIVSNKSHATVEGHGHLFPQSAPQQSARLISDWLAEHRL